MFQPNGIRALRELSLQNQLERRIQNDSQINQQIGQQIQQGDYLSTDQLIQQIKQDQRNPIKSVYQQKNLLKGIFQKNCLIIIVLEINQSIEEIQIWRQVQNSKLQNKLKINQIELEKNKKVELSCLDTQDYEEEDFDEYQMKSQKLQERLGQYRKDLKLNIKDKIYTQSQLSSEQITSKITERLAQSQSKLSNIKIEKIMGQMDYQNNVYNSAIEKQIENDQADNSLSSQLNDRLIELNQLLEIDMKNYYYQDIEQNNQDDGKQQQMDMVKLNQQTSEIQQQYGEFSKVNDQLRQELVEFNQDFYEIDQLMSQCGIK